MRLRSIVGARTVPSSLLGISTQSAKILWFAGTRADPRRPAVPRVRRGSSGPDHRPPSHTGPPPSAAAHHALSGVSRTRASHLPAALRYARVFAHVVAGTIPGLAGTVGVTVVLRCCQPLGECVSGELICSGLRNSVFISLAGIKASRWHRLKHAWGLALGKIAHDELGVYWECSECLRRVYILGVAYQWNGKPG